MQNIFYLFFFILFFAETSSSQNYFPLDLPTSDPIKSEKQSFKTQAVVTGLDIPWSMAFLPNGSVLITERPGRLRIV